MRKKIFRVFLVAFAMAAVCCVGAFAAEYPEEFPELDFTQYAPSQFIPNNESVYFLIWEYNGSYSVLYSTYPLEVNTDGSSGEPYEFHTTFDSDGTAWYGVLKIQGDTVSSNSPYAGYSDDWLRGSGNLVYSSHSLRDRATGETLFPNGYPEELPEPDLESDILYQLPGVMKFDGEGDYLLTGVRPFDQARDLTFVISFSADSQENSVGQAVLVSDEAGDLFKIRDNSNDFWALEGNGHVSETLATDSDGSWRHRWDNTAVIVAVYKDGVFDRGQYYLVNEGTVFDISKNSNTAAFVSSTSQIMLGSGDPWNGRGCWKGTVHDFRVYDRALSVRESSALVQLMMDTKPSFLGDLRAAGTGVLSWAGSVAETIAGEPVLLLTVGVFILGAAIGIFRRLLQRG